MINASTIKKAEELYDALDVDVYAEPGTLLADLVTDSVSTVTLMNADKYAREGMSLEQIAVDSSRVDEDGSSQYALTMQACKEHLVKLSRGNLTLAKTVVLPLVDMLYERYQSRIDSENQKLPPLITVVPYVSSEIWSSGTMKQLFESYSKGSMSTYVVSLNTYPVIDAGILERLIKPPIASLEQAFSTWYASLDTDKIMQVYDIYFRGINDEGKTVRKPAIDATMSEHHKTKSGYSKDDILLVWLIASNFEDILDSVEMSSDINAIRADLAKIKSAAGYSVNKYIEHTASIDAGTNLVYRVEKKPNISLGLAGTDSYVVHVNGNVYTKYLNEGGTPEAVFGSVLMYGGVNYNRLTSDGSYKQKYEEHYKQTNNRYNFLLETNVLNVAHFALKQTLMNFVEFLTDESIEEYHIPHTKEALVLKLKEKLAKVKPGHLKDNVDLLIERIVATTFYDGTDVHYILDGINSFADKDLDVREAALLTKIAMMSKYLASMMGKH